MAANVRDANPGHEPPERLVGFRADDQMPVMGHQAIRQELDRLPLQSFRQHSLEAVKVILVVKQAQAGHFPS